MKSLHKSIASDSLEILHKASGVGESREQIPGPKTLIMSSHPPHREHDSHQEQPVKSPTLELIHSSYIWYRWGSFSSPFQVQQWHNSAWLRYRHINAGEMYTNSPIWWKVLRFKKVMITLTSPLFGTGFHTAPLLLATMRSLIAALAWHKNSPVATRRNDWLRTGTCLSSIFPKSTTSMWLITRHNRNGWNSFSYKLLTVARSWSDFLEFLSIAIF